MSGQMKRVPMKLNRITVLALNEYKRIKYLDMDMGVTNGDVLSSAYNSIASNMIEIDWKIVNKTFIPNVSDNKDMEITNVNTTFTVEETVVKGIEKMQDYFKEHFETSRVYKTFVVKLILFAAILKFNEEKGEGKLSLLTDN